MAGSKVLSVSDIKVAFSITKHGTYSLITNNSFTHTGGSLPCVIHYVRPADWKKKSALEETQSLVTRKTHV